MNSPFVTIILPAYNAEKYLQRAITSLLNQTHHNFELVIIDDGSTDGTWDIITQNNDSRIMPHRFHNNKGLIAALNYGLKVSKGDYIARMDADDIALPEKLERQIVFLESNPDHCACGTSIFNFNETYSSYMRYPVNHEEIITNISLFERNICHPTVMIRRRTLQENNIEYRQEYIYAEDYQLWIELSKHGKLHNLKEALLKYHRHDDQLSCKHYSEQIATSERIVSEQLHSFYKYSLTDEEIASHLDLLIHPTNKKVNSKNREKIKFWNEKLLASNEKHGYFDEKHFSRLIAYKYFRSTLYYNFPFREKLIAGFNLIKLNPAYGSYMLLEHSKRFIYYRVIKPLINNNPP